MQLDLDSEGALPDWLQDICQRLLADPDLEEILVNGSKSLVEIGRVKKNLIRVAPVSGDQFVESLQDFVADRGLRLDPLHPFAGGQLTSGGTLFRWHVVIPPVAPDGAVFSIRRHRFENLTLDDFDWKSPSLRARLEDAFDQRGALLVAGPTGAGKTSLLHAWLDHFARARRVVILERVAEIPARHASWIRMVEKDENVDGLGGFSLAEIFQQSLRLRPELLVVGEIRSSEADVFLEAAGTGHQGVAATIHAACVKTAWARLLSGVRPSRRKVLAAEVRGALTVVSIHPSAQRPIVAAVERP